MKVNRSDCTILPEHVQTFLRDVRTFEAAYIIRRLVGKRSPVLCVGDEWGRDYYTLTSLGCHVFNLDIAWQPHLPRLTLGDVSRVIPFRDRVFDAVLLADVLEHLFDDARALREARRVLKDDGLLVVTVPFFNDAPEYHMRLYSASTIRRLLAHSGFQVTRLIYRGGLISFPRVIGLLCRIFDRPTVLKIVAEVDCRWGTSDNFWMRRSLYYGCYIMARKSDPQDFRVINMAQFSSVATLNRMNRPRE